MSSPSESAIISVDASRLEILHDRYMLIALRRDESFEVAYSEPYADYPFYEPITWTRNVVLTRVLPGPQNTGDFPINLFGQWIAGRDPLAAGGAPCQGQLTADTLSGSCDDAGDLPAMLRDLRQGQATGRRTAALPSMFGDLGGVWEIEAAAGGGCTITFEAQRIDAVCTGGDMLDGTLEAQFQGTLMSGRLSSGYEFSAQRR